MLPGEVVADRFVLEERIGAGAAGVVFRARDRATGQTVALKVLRDAGTDDPRFLREAGILARLDHPAVVGHRGHGRTAVGTSYLAMEWLEGETLSRRLARESLGVREAVIVAMRIADALSHVHRHHVVHRDVKPANIFLPACDPSQAKLLDFGIARPTFGDLAMTSPGMLVGTPGYMAPEQARGEVDLDARADVFALGCVLYRCLAGVAPFEGHDALATLAKIVLQPPTALPSHLPPAVVALVERMLAKDREERLRDGSEVKAALAALDPAVLDDSAPEHRAAPAALLGDAQQQVVSVVVVGARTLGADEPTWADGAQIDPNLVEAARPFGARVDWLMDGTSVIAFQGQGNAADQAALAARCALALRSVTAARIVLATGRSVVSGGTLIGEVIDRAFARLRAPQNEPLGICVDEITVGLLPSGFLVERTEDERAVLTGTLGLLEPPRTLLRRPTPCVGRKRELSTLAALFDECISEPVARVALITAEPGLGKSRLRHEHLQYVARTPSVEVWLARGDPMSAGAPLALIGQFVRRACGIREGESREARRDKLASRVERNVAERSRLRVRAFLGELIGAAEDDDTRALVRHARHDGAAMADQTRRAWLELLAAETRAHPVVLVIEDLHWGDQPSVDFVDRSLRTLPEAPLMVLALARPEVHDLFPRVWSERALLELRLAPLGKKACLELVDAALGEGHPDAAGIVARSAGNAFYLEELIRAVSEGRSDTLPETVLAMVQTRLDALEPDARRILRAGSIFGQTFPRNGVLSLVGADEQTLELDRWLEVLRDCEVLGQRGEGRFADHEYTFRHAILRDGAYAMLTEEDRRLGHRLAATWLESAGERDAMVLAEHCERGGDRDGAAAFYTRAAQQALAASDLAAAIVRAERGVACGASGPLLGALHLVRAEAHRLLGEWTQARDHAFAALERSPSGSAAWSQAGGELAAARGVLRDDEGLSRIAEALRTVDTPPEAYAARAVALARAIVQLVLRGHSAETPPLLARLESLAAEVPEDAFVAGFRERARGLATLRGDDVAGWMEMTARATALFEEAGDLRSACTMRLRHADSLKELGAYEDAERELRETLEIAAPMGLAVVTMGATQLLGLVLALSGDPRAGRPLLEKAIALSHDQGDARHEGTSRVYLAQALLLLGETQLAEEEARRAVELLEGTPPMLAPAHATLARVLLASGRVGEALNASSKAVATMDALDWIEEGESLVLSVHAEVLQRAGRHEAAREAFARARARLDEQAARIADERLRSTFLEHVAESRRILGASRG